MTVPKKLNQLTIWAREWFLANIAANLVTGTLIVVQAYLLSLIINEVHLNKTPLNTLMPLLKMMLLVIVLRSVFTGMAEFFSGKTSAEIKTKLRSLLLHRTLQFSHTRCNKEETGELSTVVVEGVEALDAYFSQYLPQLVIAVLLPLIILLVVFPLDWLTGIILLFTAPLIPVFMILIGRAGERMTRKQWVLLSRLSNHFLDTLQGLEELKRLNQSLKKAEEVRETSFAYARATTNVLRVTFLSALVLEMVGTLSTALIAVQIGLRLLDGGIAFQQAFFILIIAPEFYFPLRQLGARFHAGMLGRTAAVRIFELLAIEEENQENPYHALNTVKLDASSFSIILDNISFRYADREVDAVNQLNLKIPADQITALVGKSGSGKTTVSNIVMRFLNPQSGRVLIGNTDITTIDVDCWRSQIAWVPQKPTLFAGTLEENLRIGNPATVSEKIWLALRNADLEDFVSSLPNGLATDIYEAGKNLSSGQIQRIALARAFLRNTPILVMDEPTAHLDPDSEKSLIEAMKQLVKKRTVLLIAHRLSTIMMSDQVVVLEKGKLSESDSPVNLIKQNGYFSDIYKQMFQVQQTPDSQASTT